MTESWRCPETYIENAKADKALEAAFKKDLAELLEKYKAEMTVEINDQFGEVMVNFYSPSKYKAEIRTKANLDVDITTRNVV